MKIEHLNLGGIIAITPARFGDDRGWFTESWNEAKWSAEGMRFDFVQDNHSYSRDAGTLRGLHYQAPPYAQDKLVRCTRGSILDVVVDVRKGSPTFGNWLGVELSQENPKQLLVPKGFLHGFLTLETDCEVQYKVTAPYDAASDGSVRWDSIEIDWGLDKAPILSAKDETAPPFAEWETPFTYEIEQ